MSTCGTVVVERDSNNVTVTVEDISVLVTDDLEGIHVEDRPVSIATLTDIEYVIVDETVGPQGPPGLPGSGTIVTVIADATIQAYHAVAVNSAGDIYMADYTTLGDFSTVLGISTVAGLAGEPITVATGGVLTTPALWTPGPLYLGTAGALVSTPPVSSFHLQVAVATSPTLLIVRPQLSITLV